MIFTKLFKIRIKGFYVKTAQLVRKIKKLSARIQDVISKQAGSCFIKKIRTLTRTTTVLLATLAHLTTNNWKIIKNKLTRTNLALVLSSLQIKIMKFTIRSR